MAEKKPWEDYESDDPKVQAEKARTKKLKLRPIITERAKAPKAKAPSTATDGWAGLEKKAKGRASVAAYGKATEDAFFKK